MPGRFEPLVAEKKALPDARAARWQSRPTSGEIGRQTKRNKEMTHPEDANTARSYVLGDSDRELDRLSTQARLLEPITRRWLHEAGIVSGMQVLDVGTGAGDVAFKR
jgi:hypothetical protein